MPLDTEVIFALRDIVLDGNQLSLPKRGTAPIFGQCPLGPNGWKMPLGMEVGLGPGDFVFDGDQLPQKKGHTHSIQFFGPCLLWPNG